MNESLGVNRLTAEFKEKRETKELAKMWSQLWTVTVGTAVLGIILATHTMPIFFFVVTGVILFALWKLQ